MIHVRQLVKDYGPRRAVDHLDLDAERGQVVGILGLNGAGKTTTLRVLTCYMPPTSGAATVAGFDIFRQSDSVRRSIGYLPESTPLYPEMKVAEQLHYFGKLHGLSRTDRTRRIDALTDQCGLTAILRRPIGHLSKGNRQRVGLAQAMLHDPPVLILDEPTSGLDPNQITEVRRLIRELGHNKTILLSTHILPEVEKTCDRVVIIHGGRVAKQGTIAELREEAKTESRATLRVEVKTTADAFREAMSAVREAGRMELRSDGPWVAAEIEPRQPGDDIRERIAAVMIERRWPMRELSQPAASLEELFIRITSAPTPAAA